MTRPVVDREQTALRLAECEAEIRALGVARLALFGSVLRGQSHAGRDVDLLPQFVPGVSAGSGASAHCVQIEADAEALARIQAEFGGFLHVELLMPRAPTD